MHADPVVHARRWKTLFVLSLSLLLIGLDNTVLNTALPTMARDLDASASDLQWIVDAYTLAFAGLLLVAGAPATATAATARWPPASSSSVRPQRLAALASNAEQLIGARALMGVGAALRDARDAVDPLRRLPVGPGRPREGDRHLVRGDRARRRDRPERRRPAARALVVELPIFLVNLPVVATALVLGRRFVPASRRSAPRRSTWSAPR